MIKTINISEADLNFLLGFIKLFGLSEKLIINRDKIRLQEIYNKLNKEYLKGGL